MNRPDTARSTSVLTVLDDTPDSATLIEWSTALAQALRRELAVVYVESTPALLAAALPFTQVLAHAGAAWSPFDTQDVERGYRAHAARLRALAERFAVNREVRWSLRSVRGVMPDSAFELLADADLMFVSAPAPVARQPGFGATGKALRKPIVAVICAASEAGARTLDVGRQLAQALSGSLQVVHLPPVTEPIDQVRLLGSQRADLLVLPAFLASAAKLANVLRPVLVVA